MRLPENVYKFFVKQGYVIVSTLDEKGGIHCSAKGIVGIEAEGKVFIIDLYHHSTYHNLLKNNLVSITAVNEKEFTGYTLQGTAKIIPREDIQDHIVAKWEDAIIARISNRVQNSIQAGKKSDTHHEAHLPYHPKYLIEIDVENIIDLTPPDKR